MTTNGTEQEATKTASTASAASTTLTVSADSGAPAAVPGMKFGKYFGVCASFHHSKACLCFACALRPDYGNIMYCSKGSCPTYGSGDEIGEVGTICFNASEKENNTECLCNKCAVYKQFAMEGADFCRS